MFNLQTEDYNSAEKSAPMLMTMLDAWNKGGQTANVQAAQEQQLQNIRDLVRKQQMENDLYQAKMPNEVDQSNYEGKLARAKSDDTSGYIPAQIAGQIGQMQTQQAAGKTALVLQPFKEAYERSKLGAETADEQMWSDFNTSRLRANDTSLPEIERIKALQRANVLREELKNSPKYAGQRELQENKLESSEYIAGMQIKSREDLARLKTAAGQGDKTAQQAIVRFWNNKLATGEITHDQYIREISGLQNALSAAKVQPGVQVSPTLAPGVLQPKPEQPIYQPGAGTQQPQPDPLGIR